MASEGVGFLLLAVSAVAGGLVTTPMTAVKMGWSFEAVWFLYSLFGLLLFPWITALATCPHLFDALQAADVGKLILTSFFGIGWGIGSQLFGIGIHMVGNSLGFALILGFAATLGFTLLYSTLLYFTLPYFTLLYFTLLYSTILYSTLLYFPLSRTSRTLYFLAGRGGWTRPFPTNP